MKSCECPCEVKITNEPQRKIRFSIPKKTRILNTKITKLADINNETQAGKRSSVLYPLTSRTKRAYQYRCKLETEWDNYQKCKQVDGQMKSINVIKNHIMKRKRDYICIDIPRIEKQKQTRQKLEQYLLQKYNVTVKNQHLREKIVEKLVKHNQNEYERQFKQQERLNNITEKLLQEFLEKEELDLKPKIQKIKRSRKLPPIDDVDETLAMEDQQDFEKEWEDIDQTQIEEIIEEEISHKIKEAQKKPKKENDKKIGKEKKEKKEKKKDNAKLKPAKKKADDFMPNVPITNPRKKIEITAMDYTQLTELIKPIEDCSVFLDEHKKFNKPKIYADELHFSCKPKAIYFEDFENDKEYKQKLLIYNNSPEVVYCQYKEAKSADDSVMISIEETALHKIIPGLCIQCTINFYPKDLKHLEGYFQFITRRTTAKEAKQFCVPFRCEIACVKINIQPTNIVFRNVPIWEINDPDFQCYKTVKVSSNMIKDCLVKVNKLQHLSDSENEQENNENEIPISPNQNQRAKTIFQFDTYSFEMSSKCTTRIKIFLKYAPFVGVHREYYEFEFYEIQEDNRVTLKKKEISVLVEVTGPFIHTEQYIDYNVCILNSVYQQSFYISNKENFRVKIGFKFPKQIKKFFSIFPKTLFLKSQSQECVSLRFIPRKDLFKLAKNYYDSISGILTCSLRIYLLLNKHTNIPPTIVTIFAILTETDNLTLSYIDDDNDYPLEDNLAIINLGEVTTYETVTAEFQIQNLSLIQQDYAFLNVPSLIQIMPNYGIGTLEPNETQTLTIHVSPIVQDMIDKETDPVKNPIQKIYKLTCTTLFKLGGLNEEKTQEPKQVKKDTQSLFEALYSKFYLKMPFKGVEYPGEYPGEDVYGEDQEIDEDKIIDSLSILIKLTIIDYWTELSEQYVRFPDTPIGSYSSMNIQFRAANNASIDVHQCGRKKFKRTFKCHFEICGGSNEINIQPICGTLNTAESVNLLLTVKPTVENHVLKQAAKVYKATQILKNPPAKGKKNIGKALKQTMSALTMSDKMSLHNCDYYPAEKEIAKNINSYNITASFTCTVHFIDIPDKKIEVHHLIVECKVIKPDFVTDLKTQYLNFGPIPVATKPKIIISIENIANKVITPKISPLSSVGPFSCSIQNNIELEKEHILKVPFTFAPTSAVVYKEYFEIKSGNTIEALMVSGEGIMSSFEFLPKFTVCRLQTKLGNFAECIFTINNTSTAPLNLTFIKICELQGKIIQKVEAKVKGKPKNLKFTDNLLPEEEHFLNTDFQIYEEESQFRITTNANNLVTVPPLSKTTKVKIRFGKPDGKSAPQTYNKAEIANTKYVAKYNVMIGGAALVKDFIVIANYE